jgi:hypothetical protein
MDKPIQSYVDFDRMIEYGTNRSYFDSIGGAQINISPILIGLDKNIHSYVDWIGQKDALLHWIGQKYAILHWIGQKDELLDWIGQKEALLDWIGQKDVLLL